ncbi:hypothetical protein BHE74_00036389 [Ensete ventricosum]|nr:hypothetical protein GW17_00029298 [Ensete ventricosum]RWW56856.1 hypothetical protein BHE74_00036389 [Ensete ventricosum]
MEHFQASSDFDLGIDRRSVLSSKKHDKAPNDIDAKVWADYPKDMIDEEEEEEETNANLASRSQPRDLEARSSSRRDLFLERLSCRSPEEFAYIYSNFCQPMEDDVAAD